MYHNRRNYKKNVRLALYKALNKNKKLYKSYIHNKAFDFLDDVKDITDLGYKSIIYKKLPFSTHDINIEYFNHRQLGNLMIENDWVLITDSTHKSEYCVALKLNKLQKYKVEIKETLTKVITVEDLSRENAVGKVIDKYSSGEIVLDYTDFTECDIETI